MLKNTPAFSGFSVKDLERSQKFYAEKLGVDTNLDKMGLHLKLKGCDVFVYEKDNHEPATFTVLNFVVGNIDKAVGELKAKGIKFEQYDLGGGAVTDEKGILRGLEANMGPSIAWFKDPDGNILSVLQDK